jgi:threonine 3-dehydrogenase
MGLAERLGADAVADVDQRTDLDAWVRSHNGGAGVDVVFEMSGAARAIQDAFAIVSNGGHVVLFGLPARPVKLDVAEQMIFKNVQVTAASGREVFATWYQTRRLLESGAVNLRPLVTHHATLDGFGDAIELLREGAAGKIVLFPRKPLGAGVVSTAATMAHGTERRMDPADRELALGV